MAFGLKWNKTTQQVLQMLFSIFWLVFGSVCLYMATQIMQNRDIWIALSGDLSPDVIAFYFVGFAAVLLAIIGFIVACYRSIELLNYSNTILAIFLIINFICLSLGYQTMFNIKFVAGFKNGINSFKSDNELAFALQTMQTSLRCCGWDSPQDFSNASSQSYLFDVPISCCRKTDYSLADPIKTCSSDEAMSYGYSTGCKNSPVVIHFSYIAMVLLLFNIGAIFFSCALVQAQKKANSAFLRARLNQLPRPTVPICNETATVTATGTNDESHYYSVWRTA